MGFICSQNPHTRSPHRQPVHGGLMGAGRNSVGAGIGETLAPLSAPALTSQSWASDFASGPPARFPSASQDISRIAVARSWKHFSNYGGINNSPKIVRGTYPVVQWLTLHTPNAESSGLILGQGTTSHMLQLRPGAAK